MTKQFIKKGVAIFAFATVVVGVNYGFKPAEAFFNPIHIKGCRVSDVEGDACRGNNTVSIPGCVNNPNYDTCVLN